MPSQDNLSLFNPDRLSFSQLIAVIVICLPFLCASTYALSPEKPLTQCSHDDWQTRNGLPQNYVLCLAQTRDGYLWFGTEEGLVRFDGQRFVVFDDENGTGLRDLRIHSLRESVDGSLWIGTEGGLTRLKEGRFDSYSASEGLPGHTVSAIYEDAEATLWIGTVEGGLARLERGRFVSYTVKNGLSSNTIRDICGSRAGGLWIATSGGIDYYKDGKFTSYTTSNGLSNDSAYSVFEQNDGTLWVGTESGASRLKDGVFTLYSRKSGLPGEAVSVIYGDRSGALWFGTNGGLARLRDGKFETYTSRDGLSANTVETILEDREGSIWIGTEEGGLNRLKNGKFTTYSTEQGLADNNVKCVYQDHGGIIWVGTRTGLSRFRSGDKPGFDPQSLPGCLPLTIVQTADTSLWIGTGGKGLKRLKDGKLLSYTTDRGLPGNHVRALYEDHQHSLWIGTDRGLARYLDNRFIVYSTDDGLSSNIVNGICESRDGSLWISTDGGGLNRLQNGRVSVYTTRDGLPSNFIRSFYEDSDGALWIGTTGGLSRFKDGMFASFTKKDGLYDNVVFAILEDSNGNLWMSCNRGIFTVNKKALGDFANGRMRTISSRSYGTADGMKSAECNGNTQPAAWKTSDGKLWFATMAGVAVIDPDHIEINPLPPPVTIEQASVDERDISVNGEAQLQPGNGRIEIHYTALSLLAPERIQFSYRLEGFDMDWIDAGSRRVAYYTNIPPGHYRFVVKACNNDAVWNEAGAAFSFNLKPHLYQTRLFLGFCLFGFAMAAGGLYVARLRTLKSHQRKLQRLVSERTDDLKKEIVERTQAEERLQVEIAERARAQEELKISAMRLETSNRELSQFAYVASHDLQEPLRKVAVFSDRIKSGYGAALGAGGAEYIDRMQAAVTRMQALIDGLLVLSRVTTKGRQFVPVDLGSVVRQVISDLEVRLEQTRGQITLDELPTIDADPIQMRQLFQNLIGNALKFHRKGVTPDIRVFIVPAGCAGLESDLDGDYAGLCSVAVEDNGIGFDERFSERIFRPFQRLHGISEYEGSGIGLSICSKIAERHNGGISVKSTPGLGSIFIISLPRKQRSSAGAETQEIP